MPRSLHCANRHAETACKKKPVRSGRDDNLAVHEDHGSKAPERAARRRKSGRSGPFGSAQGRRNDRSSCFWWGTEGDNWQDVCRRNVPPVCHPERRTGGFCRAGVEGSRHSARTLEVGFVEAPLALVAPGKSALRSRNVGLRARIRASFFSRRQFLICFSLLIAARTSVKGSK